MSLTPGTRRGSVFAIVFLGWTVLVVHGQSTASLLINGSFEQGPAVGTFLNLEARNTSLPGWTVTGEGVDYVSTGYWISSDGTRAIDLDGSARSRQTPPYVQGGIAQTFATKPGTRYRVTFDLAGNPNRPPEIKRFQISAAGQSAQLSFDARGKNGRNMGWLATTWTFTAKDAATTLEFKSLTTSPQTGFGAAVDNVSVVPENAPALVVRETDTEIQVQLGSEVLFDTGRFELKPAATSTLEALAALLAKRSTSTLAIEGHTDSVGSAQSNRRLSENRANAVRQWLVAKGIPASRITTQGFGSSAPVATNDTADGRQKNRRVEVRVQK
jgi:choice-of-anchor C domain-containing protein